MVGNHTKQLVLASPWHGQTGQVISYRRAAVSSSGARSYLPSQAPSHRPQQGKPGQDGTSYSPAITMHHHRARVEEPVKYEAGHSVGTMQSRHG